MNELWCRQLIENMIETSKLMNRFKTSPEPNVDDLDKAMALFEENCHHYELNEMTIEDFIEMGKSLQAMRAKQALKIILKGDNHE